MEIPHLGVSRGDRSPTSGGKSQKTPVRQGGGEVWRREESVDRPENRPGEAWWAISDLGRYSPGPVPHLGGMEMRVCLDHFHNLSRIV